MRKRARWTKAMRAAAAERGRAGNGGGSRLGGLVTWGTRTPEERERIRAMLRTHGGKQTNTSARARAAQAQRARDGLRNPSQAKAEFLADARILKRSWQAPRAAAPPVCAPGRPLGAPVPPPVQPPWVSPFRAGVRPVKSDYVGHEGAYWGDLEEWQAGLRKKDAVGLDTEDVES